MSLRFRVVPGPSCDSVYPQCTYAVYTRDVITPARNVRVDDELWEAALAQAKVRRETVSDVVRRALLAYVENA